jgi:hypothetical protein
MASTSNSSTSVKAARGETIDEEGRPENIRLIRVRQNSADLADVPDIVTFPSPNNGKTDSDSAVSA